MNDPSCSHSWSRSDDTVREASPVHDLLALAGEQRDAGKLEDAEATSREALKSASRNSEAHRMLGTILHRRDRLAEAVDSFEEAVRLDPTNAKAFKQLTEGLAERGRLSDAIRANRRILELVPDDPWAWYYLSGLKTFRAGDPDLLLLEALVRREAVGTSQDAALLHFALAKAYEDVADYGRSFACLQQANALMRSMFEYDVAEEVDRIRHVAAVFKRQVFSERMGVGSPSELPVLIVGMPRTGTTLVEQILASHPLIFGAGELDCLHQIRRVVPLLNESLQDFPEGVPELASDAFRQLGEGYVERLRTRSPNAMRITDKQLTNFLYLGLARLITPNARIIHCTRDPVDTCLSCYKVAFDSLRFAFDLEDLGRFYRAYAQLMDHWNEVLPANWILEVRYENLITNLELEARRIVAHAGVDWDEACLAFHTNDRPVRSASLAQVRRPIYRDAVGRWRHYQAFLGPLFAALKVEPGG